MRRIGCFVVAVLAVTALAGTVAGGLLARHGLLPVALLAAIFVLMIVAITAGGMRRMTRPLDNLIETAVRIEAGDYSARVPERGPQDIRSVARAFNAMSARLETIDEQRRSVLADIAHELRTPLSVIRGQTEAIADGLYPADAAHLAPILDATHALDRLIEDLRTLVLTDAGNLVLKKEATDLGALVEDAVDSFRAQAEAGGVTLSAEITEPPVIAQIDPARMRSAIGNLLSNAVRHTPPSGSIRVQVKPSDQRAVVTVADDGEGIPPHLLPHIFERFVKGASSPGAGLGLAIAQDIVSAHGGQLTIESQPGSGTRATVTLPANPLPAAKNQ